MFYLELLQTALLAAITAALWRKAAAPAETEQPDGTPSPTPDPSAAPAAPRSSRPLYPRRYEKMLQDMLTRFHNEFFHQLGQMQNPPMGSADTPAGSPATPPNVSHHWGSPQGRPVKVPRPVPTPRGDCAFLVKRGDQVIGTRPAGHPDELEALSCDRLHVEYLEGDNS